MSMLHTSDPGGAGVVAPHDPPGFRSAVIADPQGAIFSVNALVA
jgi:hypothetical protein